MIRKWLALLGLVFTLASIFAGMAWAQYWLAMPRRTPAGEELGIWRFVEANLGVAPEQALIFSLAGLVIGVMLTLPWWHKRLQQESNWWEKREEPLNTWPPAGM